MGTTGADVVPTAAPREERTTNTGYKPARIHSYCVSAEVCARTALAEVFGIVVAREHGVRVLITLACSVGQVNSATEQAVVGGVVLIQAPIDDVTDVLVPATQMQHSE